MAAIGRPPKKLTPESVKAILDGVELGMAEEHAGPLGGVSGRTISRWKAQAEEDAAEGKETEYVAFWRQLEEAKMRGLRSCIATIKAASRGWPDEHGRATERREWAAAAWLAERRYPEMYGRKWRAEVTGAEGGAIVIKVETGVPKGAPVDDGPAPSNGH